MVDEKINEETDGQSLTYFQTMYFRKDLRLYIFIPMSGSSFVRSRNILENERCLKACCVQ
jgi:hypothetical protein